MKETPANFRTEKAGVLAIDIQFHQWGWIWRPTPPPDTGIDGTVEIVDQPSSATGRQLAVQSKAGRSYMRNETDSSFDFYARPEDVAYWMTYSLPVVLFVYDPTLGLLYGISVKDYVRDKPEARASPYKFIFNKEADLVDESARDWLRALAHGTSRTYLQRVDVVVREVLHTNLLTIINPPAGLYSSTPKGEKPVSDSWGPGIFIERDGKFWTLHDPMLVASPVRAHIDTTSVARVDWLHALKTPDLLNYIRDLLNRSLRSHFRGLPIGFDHSHKRYFFLPKENEARTWEYQSVHRKAKRKVAHPMGAKYWAHQAVRLTWEPAGGAVFLKVVPAYVFTEKGGAVQADEDVIRLNVRKRKREYNRQVFQHLIFWREVLAKGAGQIRISVGADEVLVLEKNYLNQIAEFGIPDDRQSLASIAAPIEEALDESALFEENDEEEAEVPADEGQEEAVDE